MKNSCAGCTNKNDKDGDNSLGCRLCEKYNKRINSNGKVNLWCTSSYQILKLSKIKEHKENEVHKEAQQLELQRASQCQPVQTTTQIKERSKHEIAIQNMILSAVYVCQQDQSIKSFDKLCVLIETLGVKMLPADLSGVSYRNDKAALEFLSHVASYLHEEILEKVKQSPSIGNKNSNIKNNTFLVYLGWMLDESTSRTIEKSVIIYVRFFEKRESNTSFYGIMGLDGDGSANSIVSSIKSLGRRDDLNPERTCWISTDNAATFTGIVFLCESINSKCFMC